MTVDTADTFDVERAEKAAEAQRAEAHREKLAAYRIPPHGIAALGGAAIGYAGDITKSFEAMNREKALQLAWDLYRTSGDHKLVLEAAREFTDFLNMAEYDAA